MEDFTQYDYQRLTAGQTHQQQVVRVHEEEEYDLTDDPFELETSPFERAILHLDLDSFFISVEPLGFARRCPCAWP